MGLGRVKATSATHREKEMKMKMPQMMPAKCPDNCKRHK